MMDETQRGAALFSDTIRTSTHDQMLSDRKDDAYRVMEAISRREGVEKVRIFNKEGRIMFSTAPGETGTFVDKKAESCYACHAAGQPLVRLSVPSRARVYRAPDGHRVLGMVTPIYNETRLLFRRLPRPSGEPERPRRRRRLHLAPGGGRPGGRTNRGGRSGSRSSAFSRSPPRSASRSAASSSGRSGRWSRPPSGSGGRTCSSRSPFTNGTSWEASRRRSTKWPSRSRRRAPSASSS